MPIRSFLKSAAVSALVAGGAAHADQVINDDLIVDGSLCVGFDCVNGEAFGFDTIRLKENNLRINFDDTSTTSSFPRNDWRIIVNGSADGAGSFFVVEDATASRQLFRLDAGAPEDALTVDSRGDVGIGLRNAVADLHIRRGDTPTVRLEQDGSSGFSPQTWDVAGNESNFFIRDTTSGSSLPFRIFPGADSNALVIDDDNDIGIGAGANPQAPLHVESSATGANILVEDSDGRAQIWFSEPTNSTSELKMELGSDNFDISFNGTGSSEFQIQRGSGDVRVIRGDLEVEAGDLITGGSGTCAPPNPPCDAVFDPEVYEVPSIEEHAAFMWQNKYLPAVGPTGPGQPINMTEKMVRMLNELEHAHIYIDQLNAELKAQAAQMNAQAAEIDALKQKFAVE